MLGQKLRLGAQGLIAPEKLPDDDLVALEGLSGGLARPDGLLLDDVEEEVQQALRHLEMAALGSEKKLFELGCVEAHQLSDDPAEAARLH